MRKSWMRNKAEAGNPYGNEILAEFSDVVESPLLEVFFLTKLNI